MGRQKNHEWVIFLLTTQEKTAMSKYCNLEAATDSCSRRNIFCQNLHVARIPVTWSPIQLVSSKNIFQWFLNLKILPVVEIMIENSFVIVLFNV